jgi:hypothetical protein
MKTWTPLLGGILTVLMLVLRLIGQGQLADAVEQDRVQLLQAIGELLGAAAILYGLFRKFASMWQKRQGPPNPIPGLHAIGGLVVILALLLLVPAGHALGQSQAILSAPEGGRNLRTLTVQFASMPWEVGPPGRPAYYQVFFSREVKLTHVRTFIGTDRGHAAEVAVDVTLPEGVRLYQRSLHKETSGIYESWEGAPVDVRTDSFIIALTAHSTVPGALAKIHIELVADLVEGRKLTATVVEIQQ